MWSPEERRDPPSTLDPESGARVLDLPAGELGITAVDDDGTVPAAERGAWFRIARDGTRTQLPANPDAF